MESPEAQPDEEQMPFMITVDSVDGADGIADDGGNIEEGGAAGENTEADSAEVGDGENGRDGDFIVNLHGLPYSAKSEEITAFLEGCIVVGGERGIHFCIGDDGRPNGDAFVELASEEDVKIALSKNRQHIGKRYVDVFQVDRREMDYILKRQESSQNKDDGAEDGDNNDAIVRLRGLPYQCTKEEIATFFLGLPIAPNGIIIVTDHEGRAAGDGFVRFASPDLVDRALEKHKEKIGHRYIEVFRSSMTEMQKRSRPPSLMSTRPRPYERPGFGRRDVGFGSRSMRGPFGDGYSSRYGGYDSGRRVGFGGGYGGRYGRDDYGGRDRYGGSMGGFGGRGFGGGSSFSSQTGHFVHMRGLPYSADEQDIAKFFSPLVPTRINIELDRSGRPSGDANVDFDSDISAREAMKKHKAMMGPRYIELSLNGDFYSRR